jgi:hypothetical protein
MLLYTMYFELLQFCTTRHSSFIFNPCDDILAVKFNVLILFYCEMYSEMFVFNSVARSSHWLNKRRARSDRDRSYICIINDIFVNNSN